MVQVGRERTDLHDRGVAAAMPPFPLRSVLVASLVALSVATPAPAAPLPAGAATSGVLTLMPPAPAGQTYRAAVAPTLSGVVVRVSLGDVQTASATVRWDRSFTIRVLLPLGDGRERATAFIRGRDILRPSEATLIEAAIVGDVQLAPGVRYLGSGGTIALGSAGIDYQGAARIACPQGALAPTVRGQITYDGDWTARVTLAAQGPEPCRLSEAVDLPLDRAEGTVMQRAGVLSGTLTGQATVRTTLLPGDGPWDATYVLSFAGAFSRPAITAQLTLRRGSQTAVLHIDPDGTTTVVDQD